jgi:phage protein U
MKDEMITRHTDQKEVGHRSAWQVRGQTSEELNYFDVAMHEKK